MKFSLGVSNDQKPSKALENALGEAIAGLTGKSPHLALVFATPHYHSIFTSLGKKIIAKSNVTNLFGCTAESIIAGKEFESQPGICIWLASLPEVQVRPFYLDYANGKVTGWPSSELSDDGWDLLLLADPHSFPIDMFLDEINQEYSDITVIGGMASGGVHRYENCLFLDEQNFTYGAVAVLMKGNLKICPVVSQGCRPIGKYFIITKAKRNIIYELGGRPALEQLQQLLLNLPAVEHSLIQHGIHLGIAVNAAKESFTRGDFLVRNIIGADPHSGSLVVTDLVRVGQTVQFHVRDAIGAGEDLDMMLSHTSQQNYRGAIIFSCNGRGKRMFNKPNHDIQAVVKHLGTIPTVGFFAAGEIGPVGDKNFLHGFTASIALFRPKGAI